jgi:asparagine synthase (glutamine-hydrolysing)
VSGYFGMLRTDGETIQGGLLQRVAEVLCSRGSTREAIWSQGGVGTCFTYVDAEVVRRSVPQPVWLGSNWIVGDIRLDARPELLRQLAMHGERLSYDTPSEELLLRDWHVWGSACLPRVLGDFSFALYDSKEQSLYCARDFIGARPLFYAHSRRNLCFSNSLAALRTVVEISGELDETFLADFLLSGYSADPARSVFAKIHRLPAGHVLKFSERSGEVEVRPFLRLPVEEPLRFSQPGEYVEAYIEVLRQAVQDRLPQTPTALYLSGGLDSGSVCAVAAGLAAQRQQADKLKAFTVSWRPLFEDPEPHFARLTAHHLHLRHEILEDPDFRPFAVREKAQRAAPEPSMDPFFSRTQRLYRRIAEHSNVILSGDGGDDVLTGAAWPYFRKLWLAGELAEMARTFGSLVRTQAHFVATQGTLPPLHTGIRSKLHRWFNPSSGQESYPDWIDPEFAKRNHMHEKWQAASQDSRLPEHPVHPKAFAALHDGFWSNVLEDEDAGCTQSALETRAPLLDLRVLRFLLRLPPVPWSANKELTRRAMRNDLPDEVRNRPKTPMIRDPLEACLESGRWLPAQFEFLPPAVHSYIDWQKWFATFQDVRGFSFGAKFAPPALVSWLIDVDNARGIE